MSDGVRCLRMSMDALRGGNYSSESVDRNESAVMDYIHGYYKEALNRLPDSLISLVDKAGFCLGFLDPISNIIANTAAYKGAPSQADKQSHQEEGRLVKKRKRSQAGTKKSSGSKSEGALGQDGEAISAEDSSIAARSLDGLVTFLTTYFRYLPYSEALRYLRLAKADLLVAVRLIEMDRGTKAFTIHQLTTKIALICAALSAIRPKVIKSARAANDPKITGLVYSSLTLASRLGEVSPLLATQGCLRSSTLRRLSNLSKQGMHGTADPRELMYHAISRLPPKTEKTPLPYDLEVSLMKVLLNRIHGFYLKAISCIPAPCLCSLYHRGLLMAGHCYGPFDPVTNIILNTIWYDTVFPPQRDFKVDMICDEILARTECRSLHGLITFATILFPTLSTYDAMRYLLFHNARLDSVISRAKLDGYETSIPPFDAYKAAADVAKHPNPHALANCATGLFLQEGEKLNSLLEVKGSLSPDDVQTISISLSQRYDRPRKPVRLVQKLSSHASGVVSHKRKEFEAHQSSIRKRVQAALKHHAQLEASAYGKDYELLVICGVNDQISKDGKLGYFDNYDGYPYSHINVWARLTGPQSSDAAPTLFFIQCSNDSEDMDSYFLCVPVSQSSEDA
ncbi:hypothetical protein EJB05_21920, partial [Eragrostis curvula]